jgi:glycine/D-amino acid oxidase-like deaminating enzyme
LKAEVVICGAGIAGIAAAYHLSVQRGVRDVVIVDELPPLSLTSDKSTECYRNWWPGPGDAMVAMTNRSIDILEALARESDNRFLLNRRGYLFATADEGRIESMRQGARESCALGAGELREHGPGSGGADYVPAPTTGFENLPTGADLITDQALIQQHFPYLNDGTIAVVHARRCGWLSAQQLGMYMLEQARAGGARLLRGRVQVVDTAGGRVRGVQVAVSGATETISTNTFVNAAGPFFKQVGEMTGIDLPVFSESHVKLSFHDRRGALSQMIPCICRGVKKSAKHWRLRRTAVHCWRSFRPVYTAGPPEVTTCSCTGPWIRHGSNRCFHRPGIRRCRKFCCGACPPWCRGWQRTSTIFHSPSWTAAITERPKRIAR